VNEGVPILKMSGAGNDFIVLDPEGASLVGADLAGWARGVCRRGVSVGADGVLVVGPAGTGRASVRFLNPDGSGAFCGNGSRCAARFAALRGMTGPSLVLETVSGDVPAEVAGEEVRITVPAPEDRGPLVFEKGGEPIEGRLVLAGVPHFVVFVADVRAAPLASWGPWLRSHPCFGPEGTNVDVVERRSDGALGIRTWERGVEGETLACGSGALAAARAAAADASVARGVRLLPASGIPLTVDLGREPGRTPAVLAGDARIVLVGFVPTEGVADISAC
jgi:diaminopimelate epimerase